MCSFAWPDVLLRYLFGGTAVKHEIPQTLQYFSRSDFNPVLPGCEADVLHHFVPNFWFHQASGSQRALSTPVAQRCPENLAGLKFLFCRLFRPAYCSSDRRQYSKILS